MAKKDGLQLKDILKDVVAALEKKGPVTEEDAIKIWSETVGPAAAAHTRPVSFKASTLTVNCDASEWLYELSTKKKEILKELSARFKWRKLKEIRFRIGKIK